MQLITGPILFFRGQTEEDYRLAAVVVIPAEQSPPPLALSTGEEKTAESLGGRLQRTVWRYEFSVPIAHQSEYVTYMIGDQSWSIALPQDGRLRIAYTACNGFEHNNFLSDEDPDRNERWRHLAEEHARLPFQLLIQGGDQLYADDVWREIPSLADWRKQPRAQRILSSFPTSLADTVADFYFEQYCRLWAQQDLAPLVASIPSLMMWDDHDIFDGWGSHAGDLQHCAVFQGVWRAAREQFARFQLGSLPDTLPAGFADPSGSHFGWSYRLGDIGIVAPDLRSERTRRRVMSESAWQWLVAALEQLSDCRSILFVSTVPVLNINLSPVERLVRWLPPGRHFYQDDLRDQWRSFKHREEWQRLVQQLIRCSERLSIPPTILSGEIHLGAWGIAEQGESRVHQLTSSGIVHHPPPAMLARIYDLFARGTSPVDQGIQMKMLPLPGLGKRYLAERNWLALDYGPDQGLEARWYAEKFGGDMRVFIQQDAG